MNEEVELYVRHRDGGRELLYMTPVNDSHYRMEVTSICGHLRYGDIIELGPPEQDGVRPYRRIVRRSGLRTQCFLLPRDAMGKPEIKVLAQRIVSAAGHCEGIAGGVFIVHLPRSCDLNVRGELQKIFPAPKPAEPSGNWKSRGKMRLKKAADWLLGLR
jgi:hypothetical protein